MQWYLQVLKSYKVFSGRSCRKECLMFILINTIVCVILNIIQSLIGMEFPILTMIYTLAVFLPAIAVAVRRLHDIERSGYWVLMGLIPVIGTIGLLVFLCQKGTSGSNRYGNDPTQKEIN